jgi:hypothetical protein
MKFKRELMHLLFIPMLLLVAILLLSAQQSGAQRAGGDPRAISIVESSLTALSGTSSWDAIRAVHLTGTITTHGSAGAKTASFDWKDMWIKRAIWYRHTNVTGNSTQVVVQNPLIGKMLKREDNSVRSAGEGMTLPPVELPGALFSVVLNDPRCSLNSVASRDDETMDTVHIDCAAPGTTGNGVSQMWTFYRSTHMPSSVNTSLLDLQNAGRRVSEEVHFTHFRTVNGVVIPDSCELIRIGSVRTVTLQTIEFPNQSQFPNSDFEVSR